jgi:hypothetical protein
MIIIYNILTLCKYFINILTIDYMDSYYLEFEQINEIESKYQDIESKYQDIESKYKNNDENDEPICDFIGLCYIIKNYIFLFTTHRLIYKKDCFHLM